MLTKANEVTILGRGVYGAAEAVRLINFHERDVARKAVSRSTVERWLEGYDFEVKGKRHHSAPLWCSDFKGNDDDPLDLSFRDLIELRTVKTFRDAGASLGTIRQCIARAAELVDDQRPFSTSKFRTDGRTLFLEITSDAEDDGLIDLRRRQDVFRSFVLPSLKDLEFDANAVVRWFPLGASKRTIVVDPAFSFGRPVTAIGSVPTEILAQAAAVEPSLDRVARLYELPVRSYVTLLISRCDSRLEAARRQQPASAARQSVGPPV